LASQVRPNLDHRLDAMEGFFQRGSERKRVFGLIIKKNETRQTECE